jgi:hypothetical protein
LTECPSCRTVYEGQPKFCQNCGYQFAAAQLLSPSGGAPSTPALKKCPDCAEEVRAEARKCRFCGFVFAESADAELKPERSDTDLLNNDAMLEPASATVSVEPTEQPQTVDQAPRPLGRVTPTKVVFALIVVAFVAYLKFGDHVTSPSPSGPDNSAPPPASIASNSSSSTPRLAPPAGRTTANVGDDIMVHGGPWICGSTKEAFSEITRQAVNGSGEMSNAVRRTHSFMLLDGTQVKVLGLGIAASKVRVLGQFDPDDGRVHAWPEDGRVGRECWAASEALSR